MGGFFIGTGAIMKHAPLSLKQSSRPIQYTDVFLAE